MRLWNYCAICGKRIEVGEACLGIEKKNTEIVGDSICFDCVKVENIPGREESVPITDLLARAEAAEARAEKAERERDAAVSDLESIMAYNKDTCQFCKNGQCYIRGGTKPCLPKWRGQKED